MPTPDVDNLLCRLWFPTMADILAVGRTLGIRRRPFASIGAGRGWLYGELRESRKWSAWDLLLTEGLSPVTVRRLLTSTLWRGSTTCYVADADGIVAAERMPAAGLRAPLGRILEYSATERWDQVDIEIARLRPVLVPRPLTADRPCSRSEWALFQESLDAYLGSSAVDVDPPTLESIDRAAAALDAIDVVAFALYSHFARLDGSSGALGQHSRIDPAQVWRWVQVLPSTVQRGDMGVRELLRALRPFLSGIERARAIQLLDRLARGGRPPMVKPSAAPAREQPRRVVERGLPWRSHLWFDAGPGTALPEGLGHHRKDLLEHQRVATRELDRWWAASHGHGALCLPTGAGKTRVGVHFVLSRGIERGKVLWLAHRAELCDQAVRTLAEQSADATHPFTIGRFEAGPRKVGRAVDVVVASIPTLSRSPNLERLLERVGSDFALVVIDECHHAAASTWTRLLFDLQDRVPGIRRLGLSATPTRTDERERSLFWAIFDELIHEQPILPLIQAQILSRPEIRLIDTGCVFEADDLDRTYFGEHRTLSPQLIDSIVSAERRNRVVIDTFLAERASWGASLIFCETIEQANFIADKLAGAGARVSAVFGDTPARDRDQIIADFKEGRLEVLLNVGVLTEGTDLPQVSTVFIVRPTRSRILFQQMVGRAMRGQRIGGSPRCTVVGFVDHVHGLLDRALATTFADEAEAYVALGIEEGEIDEDPEDVDETDDEPAKPPIPAPLVEALRAAIGKVHPSADIRGAGLLGWWEVVGSDRRLRTLPVFEGLRHDAEAWIARLSARGSGEREAPASIVETFAADQIGGFAKAVRSSDEPPRFVDLAMLPQLDVSVLGFEDAATRVPASRIDEAATLVPASRRAGAPEDGAGLGSEENTTRSRDAVGGVAGGAPARVSGWLAAARDAERGAELVVIGVDGVARAVPKVAVETAREVAAFCRREIERGHVEHAVGLAVERVRDLGVTDEEAGEIARAILAERGDEDRRPTLQEAALELDWVDDAQHAEAIELLHRVYFRGEYATALLLGTALWRVRSGGGGGVGTSSR